MNLCIVRLVHLLTLIQSRYVLIELYILWTLVECCAAALREFSVIPLGRPALVHTVINNAQKFYTSHIVRYRCFVHLHPTAIGVGLWVTSSSETAVDCLSKSRDPASAWGERERKYN